MKIIQITDLHVANEGQDTFGVNVRQNFLDILKAVKSHSPDLIVLTGDICFDVGETPVYKWVKSHLDFFGVPYAVICGNHDDTEMLTKVFKSQHLLVSGELYYKRLIGNDTLLFLETSNGMISNKQLSWVEYELSKIHKDLVIFMHHPPVVGGVPHMDSNYALQNMDSIQEIFFNFPHHITVFCGHYHVDKTLNVRNLTVHITPSTYFQINWHIKSFKIDHYRIAFREINMRNDGVVESTVVYLDGNKY